MTSTLAERHDVIPVRSGDREIGAYVIAPDRTRFVPAVDVTAVVGARAPAGPAALRSDPGGRDLRP